MLYRLLLLGITGSFLTMWGLLIRSEMGLSTGWQAIPVEHAVRELFQREQPSELWIMHDRSRVGHLSVSGKAASEEARTLSFYGSAQVSLMGASTQRFFWNGELHLDRAWQVSAFHLVTTVRDPATKAVSQVELQIEPPRHIGSFLLRQGDHVADEHSFSLDAAGFTALLSHLGLNEVWQKQLTGGAVPSPHVAAHPSSLLIHGVTLETYRIDFSLGEQTLLSAQLSQIGEVLHADTPLGWTLDQD